MPNQYNFYSDVTSKIEPRYVASRIVNVPSSEILYEELPGSFAYDIHDNIELHFYTISTNQLILSTIIKLEDEIVKSHVVSYADRSYKNYIRIDFTKLFIDKNLVLVPGDYRMVINFFSDEIGSYDNKILNIDKISDSRTEVQLSFNNTIDDVTVDINNILSKEFVEKGLDRIYAVGAAEKIFRSGVELNDPTEGINASTIANNIDSVIAQTYDNTIGRIDRIQLRSQFDTALNNFIVSLYESIAEEIFKIGDERIQEDEYQDIINAVVDKKLNMLQSSVSSKIRIS